MAILLDTTVLIDALRGRPAAERIRALRARGDVPYVCSVNAEEIARGLLPGEEAAAGRLLRALRPAVLRPREGVMAGEWRRAFARRGITLSQADCLIAAAALAAGARLATGNPRDFPMPELTVDHWPVGD